MSDSSRSDPRISPDFERVVSSGTDDEHERLSIERPRMVAAGLPAVWSTLRHAYEEMGVIRGARALLRVNQKDGFDCQSCAWPNPDDHRHVAEFCENGAKAVAEEATTRRIDEEFFQRWSVRELATRSEHWLGQQGRLTCPMVLRPGSAHYEPIAWDDAFTLIAAQINSLASPDEAIFYTSGRTSNEAAFLYQLFVRQFGTNNLPDCSNMCHESSGVALNEVIGIGKGTVTLGDFDHADAIFILGQNPGTNHPRMLSTLESAKRRGCTIVSINPLPEAGTIRFKNPQEISGWLGHGTRLTDLFLQVRINGDAALLKAIMKEMLEEEARRPGSIDREFIERSTSGFDSFAESLRMLSWQELIEQSGVPREQIRKAAAIALRSRATICCWAMGLTQHRNAVATIQEVVNFLLLRGNIGRRGAGVCPVRGHSNVQGDRTMGIWERPAAPFLDALAREFSFEPPRHHGFATVDAIRAMHDRRASVFIGLGGNFLSATPDTLYTAEAMRRCRLTVQISTKLNRAHAVTGETALILPCLGRSEIDVQESGEQFVTVEDSMGIISASRGRFAPASEHLRSEPAIIAGIAAATLGHRSTIDWLAFSGDYERIRDAISSVVPGFTDFNRRIRTGSFYLANAARDGEFRTEDGKAHFTAHPLFRWDLEPSQYLMMTIRSHDQFNTTIYGLEDRYRGISRGRRVVFMNARDVEEAGLEAGQLVDLTSHFQGEERTARRFAVVPYSIPRRSIATYFPEANVLVPVGNIADKSKTPVSKSVVVSIQPSPPVPAVE